MPASSRARFGGWLSLLVHVLLLLTIVELTRGNVPWVEAAGPDSAAPRGGGGGRLIGSVSLPAYVPPTPPPVPAPVVIPRVIPPVTITRPVRAPPPAPADSVPHPREPGSETGSGGGTGGGTGTGAGPGTGSGAGPGTGVAVGADSSRGRARPPESTRLILPPFDYPRSMRGQTIDVNFFVLADGRVDRVVFIPDIADRSYARKLEDAMKAYRFRPARDASGQPIAGIAIVRLTF
jgi:protein TonB